MEVWGLPQKISKSRHSQMHFPGMSVFPSLYVSGGFFSAQLDNNETSEKRNKTYARNHSKVVRTKMHRLETCDLIPASSSLIEKDPVQLKTCKLKICSFQKRHRNQKGGCPDTLDIHPWIRPWLVGLDWVKENGGRRDGHGTRLGLGLGLCQSPRPSDPRPSPPSTVRPHGQHITQRWCSSEVHLFSAVDGVVGSFACVTCPAAWRQFIYL